MTQAQARRQSVRRGASSSAIASPLAPTREGLQPCARAGLRGRAARHRRRRRPPPSGRVCSSVVEQPHLRAEIVVEIAVMIEMIAREIGEGGEREPHAVEPALVDAERRRLHREMGDAAPRQVVERLDAVRPGRASSARHNARREASTTPIVPSDAASKPSDRQNLAQEGDDRGLAAGAGDGDDVFRLARIKARGGQRQGACARRRRRSAANRTAASRCGDHHAGAARPGVGDEVQAVALAPGMAKNSETGRRRRGCPRSRPAMSRSRQGRSEPAPGRSSASRINVLRRRSRGALTKP